MFIFEVTQLNISFRVNWNFVIQTKSFRHRTFHHWNNPIFHPYYEALESSHLNFLQQLKLFLQFIRILEIDSYDVFSFLWEWVYHNWLTVWEWKFWKVLLTLINVNANVYTAVSFAPMGLVRNEYIYGESHILRIFNMYSTLPLSKYLQCIETV